MKSVTKKEALLQAAKELFGEYGFAETTFKKISDRAGVALGLLTHHYGNKEKLFFAAGMDVLEHFLSVLRAATEDAEDGRTGVLCFCRAYLEFSIDPHTNWLVLVRCSPYSDMKASDDREIMLRKFAEVHRERRRRKRLPRALSRGGATNEKGIGYPERVLSGHTDNADAACSRGCGYSRDGIHNYLKTFSCRRNS